MDPLNADLLLGLVFEHLGSGKWPVALEFVKLYQELPGRENIGKLRCGLLEAQLSHLQSQRDLALGQLAAFHDRIAAPWFQSVANHLLGKLSEEALWIEAAGRPELLLTAHTALGLWAEGCGQTEKAIAHYMEALGTYRDEMAEYQLAVSRIKALRSGVQRD